MTKAKKSKRNPHMGGTFDDFLREEGIYEAVQTTAMKRILAMQLADAMEDLLYSRAEIFVDEVERLARTHPKFLAVRSSHRDHGNYGPRLFTPCATVRC
jgi:hypothetical protein